MTSATYRLGIDIGGTFTDLSLLDVTSGAIATHKVPSTPASPSQAVRRGIEELTQRLGTTPRAIASFVHGTTIALNATLERRGANVALIVTRGTRDILELARLAKPNHFNLHAITPEALVPRRRVIEIGGRIGADGSEREPLLEADIDAALATLEGEPVDSFAVCLLNAYLSPTHERRVRDRLRQLLPAVHCSVSTDLWPEMREYERAVVACLNAYVQPVMSRYVDNLQRDTRAIGLEAQLYITRSNGGMMSAASAREVPVNTMLSGPASGVVGAAYVAGMAGVTDAVTCDIGGTSADVSLIRDGEPVHSTEAQVGHYPLVMPSVDVFAVGAGGGSIAWFDALGLLKLGPRSAGASPGPACYGQGGTEPTVTDAYVVCGFVNPDNFVGGTMKLDPKLAQAAIGRIAARLGTSVEEAADSILSVATANMVTALLPMMTKRGIDPRDFTLVPFGGAGATHACLLAQELIIPRVMIPPSPGTLCALGAMIADVKGDYIRSVRAPLDGMGDADLRQVYDALEVQAREWLAREATDLQTITILRWADMRYAGQAFDVAVDVTALPAGGEAAALADHFHSTYHVLYETSDRSAPIELVNLRVRITGRKKPLALPRIAAAASGSQPPSRGTRTLRYGGHSHSAPIYQRDDLLAGHLVQGPALIEQFDTTTVVAPGFTASTDAHGILMLTQHSAP